jgi:hypothetical protein
VSSTWKFLRDASAEQVRTEGVRLAAIKDALDRAGLKPATIVDLEVSPKPFELVFDSITAGPRTPTPPEIESGATESGESDEPDVVIGEIDEDPLPEDDEIEPDANEAEVIDVEIEAIEDSGYTDAIMSDQPVPITSADQDQSLSADLSGPLIGPPGRGLMTLEQANEVAAQMRSRANARSARRR